jgi:glycerol-3-phosphate acyltransferase PlsY
MKMVSMAARADCRIATMNSIAVAICAYLIGSVSFAVLVSRAFGLPDPRSYGSRNPGATNVLRSGRKAAAVLTLLGDGLKGWLAVYLAQRYALDAIGGAAVAGVGVVLGHVFPVFHRFSGGKGVSTAAGALFALNVWLGLGTLLTWIIIAAFFRISSLAAIIAAIAAPVFAAMLFDVRHPYFAGVAALAAILLARHWRNIVNLLTGTESRIGERAS